MKQSWEWLDAEPQSNKAASSLAGDSRIAVFLSGPFDGAGSTSS